MIGATTREAFANDPRGNPLAPIADTIAELDRHVRLTKPEAREATIALMVAMNIGRSMAGVSAATIRETLTGVTYEMAIRDVSDRLEGLWMFANMLGVPIDHDAMAETISERGYPLMAEKYRDAADHMLSRTRNVPTLSTAVH